VSGEQSWNMPLRRPAEAFTQSGHGACHGYGPSVVVAFAPLADAFFPPVNPTIPAFMRLEDEI